LAAQSLRHQPRFPWSGDLNPGAANTARRSTGAGTTTGELLDAGRVDGGTAL